MKRFLFLYPMKEIIDWEISQFESHFQPGEFQKMYAHALNTAINLRYRQNEFQVNFAVFSNAPISDIVQIAEGDKIIDVGLDFKAHQTKQPNGKHPYPNPDFIVNQLTPADKLVVAGFHKWDCVNRIAGRTFRRGIDTLVDEDLTENLGYLVFKKEIVLEFPNSYDQSANVRKIPHLYSQAKELRKKKPWFIQFHQS